MNKSTNQPIKFVLQLLIFINLISCNSGKNEVKSNEDELSIIISKLVEINVQYGNNEFGWQIHESIQKDDTTTVFSIKNIDGDTSYYSVIHFNGLNEEILKIHYLDKMFEVDNVKHRIRFKKDTLYYYTQIENELNFIVGRYNYFYSRGLMNSDEEKYYLDNIDSLTHVRGGKVNLD